MSLLIGLGTIALALVGAVRVVRLAARGTIRAGRRVRVWWRSVLVGMHGGARTARRVNQDDLAALLAGAPGPVIDLDELARRGARAGAARPRKGAVS